MLAGHIGFLGRSGVFLFVAILMFRTIKSPDINSTDETTIGNALSQLQKTHGGRAGLFILGFLLLVYGTFAVCCDVSASLEQPPVVCQYGCSYEDCLLFIITTSNCCNQYKLLSWHLFPDGNQLRSRPNFCMHGSRLVYLYTSCLECQC